MKKTIVSLGLLFFIAPTFANEAPDGFADRIMMQCPQVNTLTIAGQRLTYTLKQGKSNNEAEKCLQLAYAEVLKNPYPVNSSIKPATKVTVLPNGNIRLE